MVGDRGTNRKRRKNADEITGHRHQSAISYVPRLLDNFMKPLWRAKEFEFRGSIRRFEPLKPGTYSLPTHIVGNTGQKEVCHRDHARTRLTVFAHT